MSAKQLMLPANRAFNSDGAPEAGATANLYVSGTSTPAQFYSDVGLTISIGSTITANAAGRFTPMPYQDETVPFRLIIKDAEGSVLDDIDPFYFGAARVEGASVNSALSDNASVQNAVNASGQSTVAPGDYSVASGRSMQSNTKIAGAGPLTTINKADGISGNFINITAKSNITLSDMNFDYKWGTFGTSGGVLMASDSNYLTVRHVTFKGIGGTGFTGGTGFLSYTTGTGGVDGASVSKRIVVDTCEAYGAAVTGTANCFGYILEDARYSMIHGSYAEGLSYMGQEYKHDSRWSLLVNGISRDCQYGFGYGESDSTTGVHCNVAGNLVASGCGVGFDFGLASYNLVNGILVDADGEGSPRDWGIGGNRGVEVQISSNYNTFLGIVTKGSVTYPILCYTGTNNNSFEIASHDTAAKIATFQSGTSRNFVRVIHPGGTRNTVDGNFDDLSGNASSGSSANVVICDATGEHFGSLSGKHWWRLNKYGGTFNSGDNFRFENDGSIVLALGSGGANGTSAGITVNSSATQGIARFQYNFAATPYWSLRVGNTETLQFYSTATLPATDNAYVLGSASFRFAGIYATAVNASTVAASGAITSTGGGIGYVAGAGGVVTQATSKSTAVTLNKLSGEITMTADALAAGAIVSFNLNNSFITTGDVLIINHALAGTRGAYTFNAESFTGSATIYVRNASAGSLSEGIVLRFVVIKGKNS